MCLSWIITIVTVTSFVIAILVSVVLYASSTSSTSSGSSYRGVVLESMDPLSMIKDVDVRTGLTSDLDYILAAFPELPNSPEFRRDVGVMAAATPRMFDKSIADMDLDAAAIVYNAVFKAHNNYLTKYGDRGKMTRMGAIMYWTTKLKIDPVCSDKPASVADVDYSVTTNNKTTCIYGTVVDRTFTNLAITLLDMYGLEWKDTYGFAVAWLLLRGSFWPAVYKTKTAKLPIEFVSEKRK